MQRDDLVECWKIANHHCLAWYGIAQNQEHPDAIRFNHLLSQCYEKVKNIKKPESVDQRKVCMGDCEKSFNPRNMVLNQQVLQDEVNQILKSGATIEPQHNQVRKPNALYAILQLGKRKRRKKKKKGKRTKHFYCIKKCSPMPMEENECTNYEAYKYDWDPNPKGLVTESYGDLFDEQVENDLDGPNNFDEFYLRLRQCFEKNLDPKSLRRMYGCLCQ